MDRLTDRPDMMFTVDIKKQQLIAKNLLLVKTNIYMAELLPLKMCPFILNGTLKTERVKI